MQTVREAVTNAFTNCLSPLFPVFSFSHSPNRSKPFSIPSSSPNTVPIARHSTTSIDLPLTSLPPSICSIPCIAPEMAIKSTLIPHAFVNDSCCSSRNSLPVKCPVSPPATIAATFMIVPSPIIDNLLTLGCVVIVRLGRCCVNRSFELRGQMTPDDTRKAISPQRSNDPTAPCAKKNGHSTPEVKWPLS